MKTIYKILYYLLIILPIFQVLPIGNTIGKIGNTPIPFILIIASTIFIFRRKKIKLYNENRYIKYLLYYLIIINIFSICIYLIFNNNLIILGENIIIKSVKGFMYFLFIYIYIVIVNTLMLDLNVKEIFRPFIITSIALFIILLWEIINPISFNNYFHGGINYNRVRLLTYESSYTISMIFIYPLISIFYYKYINKKVLNQIVFICIFMSFILTSGSKSILINIPIVTVIIFFIWFYKNIIQKEKKINLIVLFTTIFISIIVILALMSQIKMLISYVNNDLNVYTSLVTRFYTLFVSIICLIKFPFGSGNALYLKVLPEELNRHLDILIYKRYNLSEIYSMINAVDDRFLGVKSGVGQYFMYWGLVGAILFFKYIIVMYRSIIRNISEGRYFILALYLFIVVGIIDFITFDVNYDIFAMFLIIQYLTRYYNKNTLIEGV